MTLWIRPVIPSLCVILALGGCACPPIIPHPAPPPAGAVLKGKFQITSAKHWNATGYELKQGSAYCFVVPGSPEWVDWFIRSGPDGYCKWWLRPVEPLRRYRRANWFALIGSIGQEGTNQFIIGSGLKVYRPPVSGELFCYANDIYCMYWNNKGTIEVDVYALAQQKSQAERAP